MKCESVKYCGNDGVTWRCGMYGNVLLGMGDKSDDRAMVWKVWEGYSDDRAML